MAPTPPQKPQTPAAKPVAKPAAPPAAAAKPAAPPAVAAKPLAPPAATPPTPNPPQPARVGSVENMHPDAVALGLQPSDAAKFAEKGAQLFVAGDFEGAIEAARLAACCHPNEQSHWVLLAASHAKRGELVLATSALKASVAIAVDHIPTWVALGEVFIAGKDFSSATKALQQAVELDKTGTNPGARRARMLLVARKQWQFGLPK